MEIINRISEYVWGKTIIVEDEFFGKMTDAKTYYECKKTFGPTGEFVEIGLEKKDLLPDKKQIDFFRWIENNYDLLIKIVSPHLEKIIIEWIPEYQITDFKNEFTLEYLYIPKCEEEIKDWRLSFYANNEFQHWCSIEMKGLKVENILIDG